LETITFISYFTFPSVRHRQITNKNFKDHSAQTGSSHFISFVLTILSLAILFVPYFNFSFKIHRTDNIITFKLQNFSLDFI